MTRQTTRTEHPMPSTSIAPRDGISLTPPHITALDLALVGSLVLMIGCHIAAAWLALGWPTAVITDTLQAGYITALAARSAWRPLLARLVTLGGVAGLLELATDAAGEHVVHSLTYPPGAPLLWASPVYMPLSWAIVLTQLGYLGWRLRGTFSHLPRLGAVMLCGLAGAVTVPFYEEMAYYAGWWRYAPAPHVGHTPLYVLLFEGAVAALLPLLLTPRFAARPLWWAARLGVVVGVWMPTAALLSWLTLGR